MAARSVIGTGSIGQCGDPQGAGVRNESDGLVAQPDGGTCARAGVERAETIPALCAASDAVTVHVAYVPATRGLVGEAALQRMRKGAMFINTSRTEVVDTTALRQSDRRKRSARSPWMSFDHEPEKAEAPFADDIVQLKGLYGTHHVGASTEQAQSAIADETVRIVDAFVRDGTVPKLRQHPAAR